MSLKNKKKFLRVICSFFIKSGGIEVFLTFPRKKRKKSKKLEITRKISFYFLIERAGKFFRLKASTITNDNEKKKQREKKKTEKRKTKTKITNEKYIQ